MQMDERCGRKTPFVPHAISGKLNQLPCQLSASDILAYRYAAGAIIAMPGAIKCPCK